jgi:DNA polymerase-3 subunit gamma/tau
VAKLLGTSSPAHVRAFVEALLARDGAAALEAVDRAAAAGEDLAALCREVVEVARRLLVVKAGARTGVAELTAAEAEALEAAAAAVSVDELIYLLRAFLDADAEMRRSPHPRVELEIAAVRTTRRPEPQALDALLAKVEDALARFRASGPVAAAPGAPARPSVVQESLLAAPAPPAGVRPAPPGPPPPVERPEAVAPAREVPAPAGGLAEGWRRVVGEIMKKKALLGTVLEGAAPLGVEGGVLILGLTGNHFHKELLTDRANRDLVNQVVQQLIPGARRFELDAGAAAGGGGARNHPAVQAALSVFQGEVVAVRPRAPEEGEAS